MPVRPYSAAHDSVPGVRIISQDSSLPRPHTGVVGSLHGNEPCGIATLDSLSNAAERGELGEITGTVFLIHGNPAATEIGLRHTKGGADLNRLFAFEFVERLPQSKWSSEHHRALELQPVLAALDAVLDLHSATAPTPPFAIASSVAESTTLGRRLGLPYLTHGWEGPGLLGNRVLLQALTQNNKPSLAIECGQHDAPGTLEQAYECALHFLVACDNIDAVKAPALPQEPVVELDIVDAVKKPSADFRFDQRLVGLQRLDAYDVVGSDANLEIRCKRPGYVIMPNSSVEVGKDMLYLAHERS